MITEELIAEYQCPGCIHGPAGRECEKFNQTDKGCSNHHAATMMSGAGTFALGLPKGFCRFGESSIRRVDIFQSVKEMEVIYPNLKSMFSIPIWKHLDKNGNTIMRWYSPRTNAGWSLVVAGDAREDFPQAKEITQEQIDNMD